MRYLIMLALLLVLPCAARADEGAEIKEAHRLAAKRYYDSFASGVQLSGSVEQNGSQGRFDAYSFGGEWVVRENFGALDSFGYTKDDAYWVGSSYELPFAIDKEDNPATYVLNLLADGAYLEDPYWSNFNYVSEDAGGYNFVFAVAGLPAVNVVLYSDTEDPQYLQMMSIEMQLSPADKESNSRRSFYSYTVEPSGEVYTSRETSREIDMSGQTVNFSEYVVENVEKLSSKPPEMNVSLERKPVGTLSDALTAPVEIPVDLGKNFFIVPVTFAGHDVTVNFILDTGASSSIFTPDAAELAGLTSDLAIPAYGHGSHADFGMGLCTTASLGQATAPPEQRAPLAGIPAAIISKDNTDLLSAMSFYGVGGILGVSVLYEYVAKFDPEKETITLYPPHLFDATKDVGTPNVEYWLDVEDLIYLKGKLNGTLEGDVVLDSGLQQDLALLRETVEGAGITLQVIEERDGMVVGGSRSFEYVKVPSFELGPMGWNNIVASLTDDSQGLQSARKLLGFVGVSLFYANRITLDLFNQKMYVEPMEGAAAFGKPAPETEAALAGEEQPPVEQPQEDDGGKTKLPIDIG